MYNKSDMQLYIYSDASYLPDSGEKTRSVGFFYLGLKKKIGKPLQDIPEPNRSLHMEYKIMKSVLALAMDS